MADSENMYPTNGEAYSPFREPKEQQVEKNRERARVQEAIKLADEIIQRYKARVQFYDSVDSIAVEIREDPEKFMRAWLVGQEIKRVLLSEQEWLEDLVEIYQR